MTITRNDWVAFVRANAEWEQFYREVHGCQPKSDAIDVVATAWSRQFQKPYINSGNPSKPSDPNQTCLAPSFSRSLALP
jgi:hypothetical protein